LERSVVASSIFEPIFDASLLEDSVIATLRLWLPEYLAEIRIQRASDVDFPDIRSYATRNEFTTFPDESIPMIVVISPGLAGHPSMDGEKRISAWWSLGIGIIAAANTEKNSSRLAKVYGAAVRAIMLQHQALDENWEYSAVDYVDEDYNDVPDPDQERTMRAARLIFRVKVENVVTAFAGPAEPDPTDPGSEWPTITSADVDVEIVPITEEV
jgi:hypothetical protein